MPEIIYARLDIKQDKITKVSETVYSVSRVEVQVLLETEIVLLDNLHYKIQ